jgi:hypothetical protein
MARAYTFGDEYGNSTPDGPCKSSNATGGGFQFVGASAAGGGGIAGAILSRHNIPNEVEGSGLPGYDIKSQDCLTMVRLSLLASTGGAFFKEVYIDPMRSIAREVIVGEQEGPSMGDCISKSTSTEYVNRVDHVIVRGSDPLPVRVHGGSVNVMGAGHPIVFQYNCGLTYFTKNRTLANAAWAQFETSPQCPEMQEKLKELVKRSEWESLVGYKVKFVGIPKYASMSMSQTTPYSEGFSFAGYDKFLTLTLGSNEQCEGGIVDISNVNTISAPILDMVRGTDLASAGGTADDRQYGFGYHDIYALLDHQCYINAIPRGQNWYLLPHSNENQVILRVRRSGGSAVSFEAHAGLQYETAETRVYYFRRTNDNIGSLNDFIQTNIAAGRSMFSFEGGANEVFGMHGQMVPGFGGAAHGLEVFDFRLAYTVQRPSIHIRSPHGDAPVIAGNLAQGGVTYTAIKIIDKPAAIGHNGGLVYPPAPPDDETEEYCPETYIESLQGTIIDMSAPFVGEEGAAGLAGNVLRQINSDNGQYETRVYVPSAGYNVLPGQTIDGLTVHNVELTYADKDSMTINVTLGPRYYQVNSFSDSKYVKRSETVTRTARVVSGSNAAGEFTVNVEGLGTYNAINSIIDPIFPGDRVEVKILNHPIEP